VSGNLKKIESENELKDEIVRLLKGGRG